MQLREREREREGGGAGGGEREREREREGHTLCMLMRSSLFSGVIESACRGMPIVCRYILLGYAITI